MISPLILASTPHRNRTALVDFAGTVDLYLHGLVDQVGLTNVTLLPIGTPTGQSWLDAFQQNFRSVGDALGVGVPNIADFEITEATDFASWTFTVAGVLESFRLAAGIA